MNGGNNQKSSVPNPNALNLLESLQNCFHAAHLAGLHRRDCSTGANSLPIKKQKTDLIARNSPGLCQSLYSFHVDRNHYGFFLPVATLNIKPYPTCHISL